MAKLVSLWVKREDCTRERENKRTGLFSKGFDFYRDSRTPTIRDCENYLDKIDACIISGFIKRRSPTKPLKGLQRTYPVWLIG